MGRTGDKRKRSTSRDNGHGRSDKGRSKFEDVDVGNISGGATAGSGTSSRISKFSTVNVDDILGSSSAATMHPSFATAMPPPAPVAEAAPAAPAAPPVESTEPKVSVDDFVPSVPVSLKELVEKRNEPGNGQLVLQPGAGGQLMAHPDTQLSAEKQKYAREMRRLHVSGFPETTTEQELHALLQPWCHLARQKWLEANNKTFEDSLPDNRVDDITDIAMRIGSNRKAFAFVEVQLADITDVLFGMKEGDVMLTTPHGEEYKIRFGRPHDYKCLKAVDKTKAVITGFPLSVSDKKLKTVVEGYGTLLDFQRQGIFTYCEFESEEPVAELMDELGGVAFADQLVLVHPLHEWLRPVLQKEGINVSKFVPSADPEAGGDGADGTGGGGESREEVEQEVVDEMYSLDKPLNATLKKLSTKKLYDHLTPQYGAFPVYPTRILVLLNCIDTQNTTRNGDFDELLMDSDYNELRDAIEEEVEKYGRVKELLIPRSKPKAPTKPDKFEPKMIRKPAIKAELLPLVNPFAEKESVEGGDEHIRPVDTPEVAEAKRVVKEYEDAVEAERRRQEEHDEKMVQYNQDLADFKYKINHPVHGDRALGRIFVEYETVEEAAFAQRSIAGRLFNNRTIVTSFLFEDILYPPAAESEDDEENTVAAEEEEQDGAATGAPAAAAPAEEGGNDDID